VKRKGSLTVATVSRTQNREQCLVLIYWQKLPVAEGHPWGAKFHEIILISPKYGVPMSPPY
jgi:hypothetical protein